MTKQAKRVREPVQAYLDEADADLLESLSERSELPKAELIRRGIRLLARNLDVAGQPFASLGALSGALDAATNVPTDLAAHHDDYLYGHEPKPAPKRRR
jgi:hypothetical protein